jgi:Fe2+ transport system protein FeoA
MSSEFRGRRGAESVCDAFSTIIWAQQSFGRYAKEKGQMVFSNETGTGQGQDITLAELEPGESGVINVLRSSASLKRRLNAMGLVKGTEITLDLKAPMGDPRIYSLFGYQLSLRNEDAEDILIQRRTRK